MRLYQSQHSKMKKPQRRVTRAEDKLKAARSRFFIHTHDARGPKVKITRGNRDKVTVDGPPGLLRTNQALNRSRDAWNYSMTLPSTPLQSRKSIATNEDSEIEALERALGVHGKDKDLPQSFKDDGLDELLYGLPEHFENADPWPSKDDVHMESSRSSRGVMEPAQDSSAFESANLARQRKEIIAGFEAKVSDHNLEVSSERANPANQAHKITREFPYVASTADANILCLETQRPPRFQQTFEYAENDNMRVLQRKLHGILNRLSETNLLSMLNNIEALYQSYPPQPVSWLLLDQIVGRLCDASSLTDTFTILYGGFVSAMSRILGPEFGAQALQRIIDAIDRYSAEDACGAPPGQQVGNLLAILAELYNFHVVDCALIYDYIRKFVADFSERSTELLLRILKSCGLQLRQDDPSSLKESMLLLQAAVTKSGAESLSVRTTFMIETIRDLSDYKKGRYNTANMMSVVASEHRIRMTKILERLGAHRLAKNEPLQISLSGIHENNWKSSPWLHGTIPCNEELSYSTPDVQTIGENETFSSRDNDLTQLLNLAKEQRMNTDVRRCIFVAIMSASDYRDASHRLLKLHLKKLQRLEIPKVLTHCVAAEEVYNPYYSLISKEMCVERGQKAAFKFCLWELLDRTDNEREGENELPDHHHGRLSSRAIVHIAKMYAQLVLGDCLNLTVLKTINFRTMEQKTKLFVEVLLVTILLNVGCEQSKGSLLRERLKGIFFKLDKAPTTLPEVRAFMNLVVRNTEILNDSGEKKIVERVCQIVDNLFLSIAPAETAAA